MAEKSYVGALLSSGVSSEEKVPSRPPPKQKNPQPEEEKQVAPEAPKSTATEEVKPAVPVPVVQKIYEGNEGGDIGTLFRSEEKWTYVKKGGKKKPPRTYPVLLSKLLKHSDPSTIANLGSTCKSLDRLITKNNDFTSLFYHQKVLKPIVVVKVDFAERPDMDPKNVSLTDLARRQNAVAKYWVSLITKALENNSKIQLFGGLSISAEKQPLVGDRDLLNILSWLDCVSKLLEGNAGGTQKVPYIHGSFVTLTRYGLGGTRVRVEVHPKKVEKVEEESLVQRYKLSDFCLKLHKAVKEYITFVEAYAEIVRTTRSQAKEKAAKDKAKDKDKDVVEKTDPFAGVPDLFKIEQLPKAKKNLMRLLERDLIPGEGLREILKIKKQKRKEAKLQMKDEELNMYKYLWSNLPSDFNAAEEQRERLQESAKQALEAKKVRDREAWEAKIESEKSKTKFKRDSPKVDVRPSSPKEGEAQAPESPQRPKKKVVSVKGADGWVEKKLREDDGTVKDIVVTSSTTITEHLFVEKRGETQALSTNPYSATLQAAGYSSILEIQHKKNIQKVKGRQQAEERERAQAKKLKKEQNIETMLKQQQEKQEKLEKQEQKQDQQKQKQKQQQNQKQKQPQPGQKQKQPQQEGNNKKNTQPGKNQGAPTKKVESEPLPKQGKQQAPASPKKGQPQPPQPRKKPPPSQLTKQGNDYSQYLILAAVLAFVALGYMYLFSGSSL